MLSDLMIRVRAIWRRGDVEREMDEELRFHFDACVAKHVSAGRSREEAIRLARLEFGAAENVREEIRDARGTAWLETLARDVKYAARVLRKSPGFTAVAILTLALGIGANTAIFSVVNSVLLRPLPYRDSSRLVTTDSNESMPDVEDIRAQSQSYEVVGSGSTQRLDYTGGGEPLEVFAIAGDAEMFPALGARAEIGRLIEANDDRYGAQPAVVLSHAFWANHFGGDRGVIGKQITLSGTSYAVVGVMTSEFWLPNHPADVFTSLRVEYPAAAKARGAHMLATYMRLKPGVTIAQAQAEMNRIDATLAKAHPDHEAGVRRRVEPLLEKVVGNSRRPLLIFLGAVGLVLLIACVNFANLLLSRAASRQREMAVRAALGAGSGRLVSQMLTESVLLALAGGAGGLLLAQTGLRALLALAPKDLPRLVTISIDGRVLAFTLGISVLTGILFGLLPAWSATRASVGEGLKDSGRTMSGGRASLRLRRLLVISETALALVLLVGAGLLLRSFWEMESVAPGFRPEKILTMRVALPESRYADIPAQNRFRMRLLETLNAIPDVQAAMISELPMGGDSIDHELAILGEAATGEKPPQTQTRTVLGNYFTVMGIPVLRGRDFSAKDREGAPEVVVVNERFAQQFFGKRDPLGERIGWALDAPKKWKTIVGVVGDVKHFGLDQPEGAAVYGLYTQSDEEWKRWMTLTVRSPRDAAGLTRDVEQKIWAIDRALPPTDVLSMADVMQASVSPQRFNLALLTIFAAVALALAAIGIYGVVAYSVTQRTHEVGVRVAIGAQRGDILRMVLGEGARLVAIGTAAGLAGAAMLTKFIASMLFGVDALDPVTFAGVAIVLGCVAAAASYVPARRAMRVDPMVALRHE